MREECPDKDYLETLKNNWDKNLEFRRNEFPGGSLVFTSIRYVGVE